MSIILFISLFVCLYKCKFHTIVQLDYLEKRKTQSISGVFVLLIFLRHFCQYIKIDKADYLFYVFDHFINQWIVIPFLFYSGYGVMQSIMHLPIKFNAKWQSFAQQLSQSKCWLNNHISN